MRNFFGTFGFEIRAYGQKLVKFCTLTHIHTHTHTHTHTYTHTHTTAAKLVVRCEETSIFAPQRLPFYKALGIAAYIVGKVRASERYERVMCVCSTFRRRIFYYSSKTDSWGRSLNVTAPR